MNAPAKLTPHIVAAPVGLSDEARQAIIEHNRLRKEQREWAAANKAKIDAEWDALPDGRPWRIEDHIEGRKLP